MGHVEESKGSLREKIRESTLMQVVVLEVWLQSVGEKCRKKKKVGADIRWKNL